MENLKPLKNLKELENQRLIKFIKGSSKWGLSSYDDPINDFKKLFLKSIETTSAGDLKLTSQTANGDEQYNHIFSNNKVLLKTIKTALEGMYGYSLVRIYNS